MRIELRERAQGRLGQAGIANAVEFLPNLTHTEKQQLLREVTILSVPTRSGEAFGLFVIEALAPGCRSFSPRVARFRNWSSSPAEVFFMPKVTLTLSLMLSKDCSLIRRSLPNSAAAAVKSSLRTSPAMRWPCNLINFAGAMKILMQAAALFLAIAVLTTGCSSFEREWRNPSAESTGIAGRWQGNWKSARSAQWQAARDHHTPGAAQYERGFTPRNSVLSVLRRHAQCEANRPTI